MPSHDDTTLPLQSDTFYHIFNRGNNGNLIFFQEKNYKYFLEKYAKYMCDYIDTYAYCLIPNHFHLLVKIQSEAEILKSTANDFEHVSKSFWRMLFEKIREFPKGYFQTEGQEFPDFQNLEVLRNQGSDVTFRELLPLLPNELNPFITEWVLSERMRLFFISYAKSINKQESRKGSLFQKNFRRKIVDSEVYLTHLVWYIHNNGVHHNLCENFEDYRWSSFKRVLLNRPSKLKKQVVLEWFGGKQSYLDFHQNQKINWEFLKKIVIEEDD